jgi:hypothetical protein
VTLSAVDSLDILDLLSRADTAAGARDAAAYLALFTPDAVLDGDQGTYRGTCCRRGTSSARSAGTTARSPAPVPG